MTVIFQVDNASELEEISQWLSKRKILVHNKPVKKIGAAAFVKKLRRYQVALPNDYRFNRDEANER
ncbi:MAG: hypothetical protein MUC59_00955 [Saprospiraceae bacterium]|jgi:hypothetical protein|nr:hypothetical protein [Saprospiraceae bacterium]